MFVGEDLDVLLALCDRILVLSGGKITGILNGKEAKKDEVGWLMLGKKKEAKEDKTVETEEVNNG